MLYSAGMFGKALDPFVYPNPSRGLTFLHFLTAQPVSSMLENFCCDFFSFFPNNYFFFNLLEKSK